MEYYDAVNSVTEALRTWEEQHTTPNYDPIPILTRLAEIIEAETESFMKKDPDPFDERHPSRTDPECALGHALKVLFKKDTFINKLVNDYLRESYFSRLNINGRDVTKLNVAACRLTLDLMPGLEMSAVFQDNESLIIRLATWAKSASEPLQCYATGLLAAAMDVQDNATNYRDLNVTLVPLMLKRLHTLRNQSLEENSMSSVNPQTRYFARFDKKRLSKEREKINGTNWCDNNFKDDGGGEMMEVDRARSSTDAPRNKINNTSASSPERLLMSPPSSRVIGSAALDHSSNSSWAEMETYVIGNIQIHPPTNATKQILILKFLTPFGGYQEFLSHIFEQNALELILGYLNVKETKDSRLAFEALKYLASLLCHKKFSIDFIQVGGLQKFLDIPRPSVASAGVSICLYYLAYCEDAMERVCLLPRRVLAELVTYALWLLECSHDSGRSNATMFFGLSFQFKLILEEFDEQDGLRKLYNVISTLPILGNDEDVHRFSEDEISAARQIVRHVCVALKRYYEAHLRIRSTNYARQAGEIIPDLPPYKASKSTPEEIQNQIELLQSVAWTRWGPVDDLVDFGGIQLLLRIVGLSYDLNFSGRSETLRSALDVISVCSVSPRVQLLLTEKLEVQSETTSGANIVLAAASGEIVPEADVQKAALNVIVNCVCSPVHRAGSSTARYSQTGSTRRKTALKSYEDIIQKVWESVRTNSGIMVLISLMMTKVPITDADRIRGLACRALAGLARCPTVRQIISQLPLFASSQIQSLMRDPILQEKRQEHVMFQKYALELLERISGKSKHMGPEFETSLVNIHKANVVAQTKINYNERQLLQLLQEHLTSRGLHDSAATLQREAGLPALQPTPSAPPPPAVYSPSTPVRPRLCQRNNSHLLSRDSHDSSFNTTVEESPAQHIIKLRKLQPTPQCQNHENRRSLQKQLSLPQADCSKMTHRVTLHNIITEYLYNQHALCKNPMVTCPQFNLFLPHKCPDPRRSQINYGEVNNVVVRTARREMYARTSNRADSRLAHSHFSPCRTLRLQDDDSYFTHAVFHPTKQQLLAATSSGDLHVFNLFNGNEENSFSLFDSYIYNLNCSRRGDLLAASSSTSWRPLSTLWTLRDYEQAYQLDNEEYVEFSKVNEDRIIGTTSENATIFDTATGRKLMSLKPTISNQYAKNRATFNPTDELVLSDGVLWDVNTGKEIHKFDKLNQTHSGVFHPNGLEIISNTEVWDLRTFHLLKTVPTLDKCEVIFNHNCTVMYAICSDQDSEEKNQVDTSFKTLDPFDYSSITTVDVKKNLYSLNVSSLGAQICTVENVSEYDQVQESCVKIYDVGRRREQDDEAEDDEDEEMQEGSDNENSDSASENDDALLLPLEFGDRFNSGDSSHESSGDERPQPRRSLRRRRQATEEGSDNAEADDVLSIGSDLSI